jgi:hypothetical protein
MAYGHWQAISQEYFPEEKFENAAELYQQVARSAARISLVVGVRKSPAVVSNEAFSPVAQQVANMVKVGMNKTDSTIESTAYAIGYRAQLEDGVNNTYDQLDGLVEVLRSEQIALDIIRKI